MKTNLAGASELRVLIVEDNNLTRISLASTLQLYQIEVVATASSATEAMPKAMTGKPNVALLDLDLGDGPTGIDLAWGLRRLYPQMGIVILTSYVDPRFTGRKLPALPDFVLYLNKSEISSAEFLVKSLIDSAVMDSSISAQTREESPLSDADIALLKLVWEGNSNSEIGNVRNITSKSVETAISRVAKKIEINYSTKVNQRILLARYYQQRLGKNT